MKKALITGITGQDGSYLAEFLLSKGYEVHGIKRRSSSFNTARVDHIYVDPHKRNVHFFMHYGDLTDATNLIRTIQEVQPDEIYNLAAQSHVAVSFETPEYTANSDALGTLRLLEAIRILGMQDKVKFYQASTSELYGKVQEIPQKETTPFYPRSPYAVAKLYSYWITINYREAYNMFTCNGILFNHECITGTTPVIIRKGCNKLIYILPIEEIVPHRENPSKGKRCVTNKVDDLEVWDGNKWTAIKAMSATWNDPGTEKDLRVHRIVCRGGYYEATAEHISFLKGEKEVKTEDIKEGDLLELKAFPSLNKTIVMTGEEAKFLGMIVADGYVNEDGKGRFINDNKNLRNEISALWRKIAGGYTRETTHPSGFIDNGVGSVELLGNRDYLRTVRKEIYTEKGLKKVPFRVLNATEEVIKSFVYGYNSCDGLKAGNQKTILKSFTTNSPVLALGLWYLVAQAFGLRITLHPEFRDDKVYFHLNVNSNNNSKGQHLKKTLEEVKKVFKLNYSGWLFDLETESGTFSAGIGLTWIHNSPRRGETFVTRKITMAVAKIKKGLQDKLYLGNLDAKRDWGYAKEYVEAMWLMLQQDKPDDYVIATGETHSVREFVELAFSKVGIQIIWKGKGVEEKGIDSKTGKVLVEVDPRYFRPTEVELLVGDATKAREKLGWKPKITFEELVGLMVEADLKMLDNGEKHGSYALDSILKEDK